MGLPCICRSVGVVWEVNVGIYGIHGVSGYWNDIGKVLTDRDLIIPKVRLAVFVFWKLL